ncbi:MAG: decarboxylating NADP(+)-dependent phosphogluconate dehydrogenase [Desulfobulbus sp.]|jgi:6-phosphogluconate dehydrogenase
MQADIGVIGLAVMGQNLILNMDDHGYVVAAYNRTQARVTEFLAGPAKGTRVLGATSLQDLVDRLSQPKKIMLMVRAGEAVDSFIEQLIPLLQAGDVLIDGGNSNYTDTNRREMMLRQHGIHFIGMGISGGEEGARFGPSIMPGGANRGWPLVQPIFEAIAAKAASGEPCCSWMGPEGSGHFVKMVHNGIEYGDMQLISEAYAFLYRGLGLDHVAMRQIFVHWNKTELESYLIEITADIFSHLDKDGSPLVERILDVAGQKGTGKWTGINALHLGVPLTLITEAVFARFLSSLKKERQAAEQLFHKNVKIVSSGSDETGEWVETLRQALLAAKVISYAQGFMLIRQASNDFNWQIESGNVAKVWRAGCIIRSTFLDDIHAAFAREPALAFLGFDQYFNELIVSCLPAWRRICARAMEVGLAMPAMTAALSFLDGYTTARLPANMIQAQRDYFGAHTYERVDAPRGTFFHTDWTGSGGAAAATSYEG